MEKQTIDLLNAIKTGHPGSIAGNPAHVNLNQKMVRVFKCNAHSDISDYRKLALSDKEIETLLKNCTTTIVLGETGEGKKTAIRSGLADKVD